MPEDSSPATPDGPCTSECDGDSGPCERCARGHRIADERDSGTGGHRMTPAEIAMLRSLEYRGGGFFRVKAPAGVDSPTLHGPEVLARLFAALAEVERLRAAAVCQVGATYANACKGVASVCAACADHNDGLAAEVARLRAEVEDAQSEESVTWAYRNILRRRSAEIEERRAQERRDA